MTLPSHDDLPVVRRPPGRARGSVIAGVLLGVAGPGLVAILVFVPGAATDAPGSGMGVLLAALLIASRVLLPVRGPCGDREGDDDAASETDGRQPRLQVVTGLTAERESGQAIAGVGDCRHETFGSAGEPGLLRDQLVQLVEAHARPG